MNLVVDEEVGALREVLAKQTVGVLVAAPLPRAVRLGMTGLLLPATMVHHLGLREVMYEHLDLGDAPVQAIEVTPEKKVVWALRAWAPPADLGPSTTIQILDGK